MSLARIHLRGQLEMFSKLLILFGIYLKLKALEV